MLLGIAHLKGTCSFHVPDGYFLLPPELGPYDFMFIVYYLLFALWVVFCMVWTFSTAQPRCTNQSKVIISLLILKAIVLVFSASFWQQCGLNGGLCNIIFGKSLFYLQLMLETGEYLWFVIL